MPLTVEELSRFVASEPPRALPEAVRAARLPLAPVVFAWSIALLVAIGTWPLVAGVFPDRLVDDLRLDLGSPALTSGQVLAVEPTERSLLRRDADVDTEVVIQRVRFRFETASGETVEGACHVAQTAPAPDDTIGVEYLPDDPDVARMPGSTLSATPRIGALVLLMPAIALAWLAKVLAQRRRVRRLLVHGRFAPAEVTEFEDRGATIGPGRVVATLRIPDGEELEVDFDAARREGRVLAERARTTRRVGLLRDPDRPTRFLLADALVAVTPEGAADEEEEEEEDEEDEPFEVEDPQAR